MDSMNKILDEMRDIGTNAMDKWADRIEALTREPVGVIEGARIVNSGYQIRVRMHKWPEVGTKIFAAPVPDNQYRPMFESAISALAEIDSALGIDADGCNGIARTIEAIRKLKDGKVATIPDALTVSQAPTSQYAKGWNDCRKAMLEAAPE